MMVNSIRGEIAAELDGKLYRLCLTLGALASLEEKLEANSLAALGERFSSGKVRSDDLIKVITAGLFGGGNELSEAEVSQMRVDGGVSGYVEIAARLLEAAFTPVTEREDD
ncbi:MAG: gene transfer agent family protein [Pseudomonadota bacterium]